MELPSHDEELADEDERWSRRRTVLPAFDEWRREGCETKQLTRGLASSEKSRAAALPVGERSIDLSAATNTTGAVPCYAHHRLLRRPDYSRAGCCGFWRVLCWSKTGSILAANAMLHRVVCTSLRT